MNSSWNSEAFPIFFGVWIVLGVISFIIFFLGKDAQLKRKLWPPFVIASSVIFIAFVYLMETIGEALYFIVPIVGAITVLNLRTTKFCDVCGKTVINQNVFARPEYCTKCGSKLNQ